MISRLRLAFCCGQKGVKMRNTLNQQDSNQQEGLRVVSLDATFDQECILVDKGLVVTAKQPDKTSLRRQCCAPEGCKRYVLQMVQH